MLVFIVIIFLFGWYLIRPLYKKTVEDQEKIIVASSLQAANETKVIGLSSLKNLNDKFAADLSESTSDYYDYMDSSEIDKLVLEKCHTLVFMGLHNEKLVEHFSALGYSPDGEKRYIDTHTLADAVQACYNAAHCGDTVLLSPCCASFDLFQSYEDRGEQFMQCVKQL